MGKDAVTRDLCVIGGRGHVGLPLALTFADNGRCDLSKLTIGILGMAFEADSDDPCDSLSYKLRKLLTLESARVLCSDPYVRDESLVPPDVVLREADVIFVGAPHEICRQLAVPPDKLVFDVWDCLPTKPSLSIEHQPMRAVA